MGDSSVAEDGMAAPTKIEAAAVAEGTPSDIESTPEHEAVPGASQDQPAQPVKRKGGRKPVCIIHDRHRRRLTWPLDLCYFRRAKTAEQAGPSCVP